MRLHIYFARRFLMTFLVVLIVFGAILVLIDLIEQIRRFAGYDLGLTGALRLSVLNTPEALYRIFPLLIILTTLALFLSLAKSSELVVVRAAGRSALRALMAPVVVALILGGLGVGVINPLVAATSKQFDTLVNKTRSGSESVLSISRDGLWLRQGSAEGQTVISAERANRDGTLFFGVTFLGFAPDKSIAFRVDAQRAALTGTSWVLFNAKRWPLGAADNPEAAAEVFDRLTLPATVTREEILDGFGAPSAIPFWDLSAFIERLDNAGFSATQHRVWYWIEVANPLFLVAMVLIGAGFTMRHTRFGSTGTLVMCALLAGFALFFLRNFAQVLGENGQLPPLLAAFGPPAIGICLSLGLLLHTEDG